MVLVCRSNSRGLFHLESVKKKFGINSSKSP
jgi:hypothetical protein